MLNLELAVPRRDPLQKSSKARFRNILVVVSWLVSVSILVEFLIGDCVKLSNFFNMSAEVQEEKSLPSPTPELRTLAREDLENLILNKIVESMIMHSSIGALQTKLLTVELQRDKLVHRVTNLQRQVIDLTKAVRSMSENVGRQNENDTQAFQPIRFYRSVGLQVAYNNNIPNSNGVLKMTNNQNTSASSSSNGPPALLSSVNGLKRSSNKPVVSIADVSKQVELEKQQKIRKISPNASPAKTDDQRTMSGVMTNSPPKLIRHNPATAAVTKIINGFQNKNIVNKVVEPGIVDLTDDDSATATAPPKQFLIKASSTPPTTVPVTTLNMSTTPIRFIATNTAGNRQTFNPAGQVTTLTPIRLITTTTGTQRQAFATPSSFRPGTLEAVQKFVLPPLPPPSITGLPRRCAKDIPPRPELTLQEQKEGIVLSWTLKLGTNHADIQTYQIYACQEPQAQTAQTKAASWKRVGDVKALPLPMACTLSQFAEENRYHFIVRGVDVYNRTGPFCEVTAITLKKKLL